MVGATSAPSVNAPLPRRVCLWYKRRMAYDSLREFVQKLEAAGELKRISTEVDPVLEITAIADREMKLPGGG